MQRIIFTNSRGQSIELTNRRPFLLSSIDGLGDVDANIQLQKAPFQDGSTFTNSSFVERVLTLEVAILSESSADVQKKRTLLASIFNPKLGEGNLRYESEAGVKEIQAVADNVPVFPSGLENRGGTFQRAMINLLCPSPFWTTEEVADELTVWEGGLEFPLVLPTFFAQQSLNKAKILFNDGDGETPIQVTFNGPATSPIRIINKTNDEFLEVRQDLLAGERLEIDTTFGKKRVVKVLADGTEQNAFHYVSLDSTFLQLEIGNNLIDYSTGADYERAAVNIKWRNRFLSV